MHDSICSCVTYHLGVNYKSSVRHTHMPRAYCYTAKLLVAFKLAWHLLAATISYLSGTYVVVCVVATVYPLSLECKHTCAQHTHTQSAPLCAHSNQSPCRPLPTPHRLRTSRSRVSRPVVLQLQSASRHQH